MLRLSSLSELIMAEDGGIFGGENLAGCLTG